MASEKNLNAVFSDIANSIRSKKGTTNTIQPINMASEIDSIETGSSDTNFKDLVEGTITSIDDSTITKVASYTFGFSNTLLSVNLPNVISIGDQAFYNCTSLLNVSFQKLTTIDGYNNFSGCTKLQIVDIGGDVELITSTCFKGCTKLQKLILRGSNVSALYSNAFDNSPIKTSTTEGFIYVPDDLVESYKSATNWTVYASKIKGLSELPTE